MDIRGIVLRGALVSVFVTSSAFGAEEGFFIGAGAGQSTAKTEIEVEAFGFGFDYDESGDAYKAYAGFNFAKWFGIEGGYVQLGDTETKFFVPAFAPPPDEGIGSGPNPDTNIKAEVKPNGWQGFGVLYLPIGNFDLFAKVGGIAANIDVDTKTTALGLTEHGSRSEGNGMWAYGGGAAWNFGHWAIRAEYEEYDTDQLNDLYVVSGSLQYTLFREKEKPAPVVAAAPTPAPKPAAVPAKCPDGDGDGVCDAADQCPTTPAGARVGPAGCDCDFVLRTHFAFDSAELTPEDKTQLDQLATVLKNPKLNFVTGEVDGYTDNVGKPEYNLALSKRRAQVVADYLKAQGVAFSDRFVVQGFGDTKPIADNKTEEGRAQNRRASIHRTDCPAAH